MKLRTRGESARAGYVILAVLIVIVVLSLVAYRFADAMGAEHRAAVRTADEAQAKAAALSGLYYAAAALADPTTFEDALGGNPFDNETAFSQIEVQAQSNPPPDRKRMFFSIVAAGLTPGSGPSTYTQTYGVIDEGGKLNINALILLDPTGQTLANALTQLFTQIPSLANNATVSAALVDAIVDWVDADETERTNGAESSYYQGLPNPYYSKDGPLNSLDELLLVKGMDASLLYGGDLNRNGIMDGVETDNTPGLANFITVYGRELNTSSTGVQRIYLNGDLSTIAPLLQQNLSGDLANYILASKLLNPAPLVPGAPTPPNTQTASSAQLATAVQSLLSGAVSLGQNGNRIKSVASLINTQITLPKPAGSAANSPNLVFPSPLQTAGSSSSQLTQLLPLAMDLCTVQDVIEMVPRINVNTAPYEVLLSICNTSGTPLLTTTQVQALMTQRAVQMQTPTAQATRSLAWLITSGTISPTLYQQLEKYITGSTMVYRVQAIGYFNSSLNTTPPTYTAAGTGTGYQTGSGIVSQNGTAPVSGPPTYSSPGTTNGPVARMEAVIDTNQGAPRFLFIRDLADLETPPGFPPGQALQAGSGSTQGGSGTTSGSGTAP